MGLGALETFSRGVGDGRYISVMRAGAAPKRVHGFDAPSSGCPIILPSTADDGAHTREIAAAVTCHTG